VDKANLRCHSSASRIEHTDAQFIAGTLASSDHSAAARHTNYP
jgi:hypothetical protein